MILAVIASLMLGSFASEATVSGYSIGPKTGALTPVPGSPFATGSSPDSVAVDPTAQFVYVANESDNTVSGSSCHRKIDGDKYRYTVEDLKQMKEEAEERARRMVHGQIVFEMKDKEQAAIDYYLDSRPLKNQLPTSASAAMLAQGRKVASGAMLGVQIIPYSAITDRPHLGYAELIEAGVPTSRHGLPRPDSDSNGVFAEIGEEVSRIDRDATAQIWINYAGLTGPYPGTADREGRAMPGAKIAEKHPQVSTRHQSGLCETWHS